MPTVRRHAHVPYTAAQMFDLVNDIEAYPRFLRWCCGARIDAQGADVLEAAIEIGIGGLSKTLKTRNTLDRPKRIDMHLISGPVERLDGTWAFLESPDGGADVDLVLDYEVGHSPLGFMLATLFDEIAESQMSAFIERARVVYG